MKLGSKYTYIEITTDDLKSSDEPYRIKLSKDNAFKAECNGIFFVVSQKIYNDFKKFQEFKSSQIIIEMNTGGYLKLTRFPRGNIEIKFEVYDLQIGDTYSIKGKYPIDGEYALQALKDIAQIIFSKIIICR